MSNPARIACLQTPSVATFDGAVEVAVELAREAIDGGAHMLCLPEYCGGLASENGRLAPPVTGESAHPMLAAMRDLALDSGVWVLIGSIAVEAGPERIRNRSLVIGDDGAIKARYDKIHLFDVDISPEQRYRESEVIAPGDAAVLVDTPFGRLGLTICYDLRFPHLYRELAKAGAEILAIPAAFTRTTGEAHWHVLNRARAIENGAFVVAPCAAGPVPGGGETYGHSLIIDPWGEVLADGGTGPGVAMASLDTALVAATRGRIPSLEHDRVFASGAVAPARKAS